MDEPNLLRYGDAVMTKTPSKPAPPATTGRLPGKKLKAMFYRTRAGNVPVLDWLKGKPRDDRKRLGEAIGTVEYTWPVPPPLVKKLTDQLWEIRETISDLNEARIIFTVDAGWCVLLHGFEKKSQKTPRQYLETADHRRKDYNEQKEMASMANRPKKS
jgi:phage-related protein